MTSHTELKVPWEDEEEDEDDTAGMSSDRQASLVSLHRCSLSEFILCRRASSRAVMTETQTPSPRQSESHTATANTAAASVIIQ